MLSGFVSCVIYASRFYRVLRGVQAFYARFVRVLDRTLFKDVVGDELGSM